MKDYLRDNNLCVLSSTPITKSVTTQTNYEKEWLLDNKTKNSEFWNDNYWRVWEIHKNVINDKNLQEMGWYLL